jgi:putative SOS response-associated peptidase YedK
MSWPHTEAHLSALCQEGDIRSHCAGPAPSNELVAQIHDRMPAILKPGSYERWLSLEPDPRDLLITYPSEPMAMWPISTRVNTPENDDPSLLDRTGDPFDVWAPLRSEGRA